MHAVCLQTLADLCAHLAHEFFERRHALIERVRDGLVARGVEIQQREVFELPLDLLHAEAVRDGGVDLHRLEGLDALLFLALVGHRAHVVQAVGHLDEDDADVLGHGQEHLAHVLHLLFFDARVLHARELRDALDDVGHRGAEAARNVLVRERGVLNRVVQQRGDDRVLVEPHLRRDDGGGDAVRHVGRAVAALLAGVGPVGALEGRAHAAKIGRDAGGGDLLFQLLIVGLKVVGLQGPRFRRGSLQT